MMFHHGKFKRHHYSDRPNRLEENVCKKKLPWEFLHNFIIEKPNFLLQSTNQSMKQSFNFQQIFTVVFFCFIQRRCQYRTLFSLENKDKPTVSSSLSVYRSSFQPSSFLPPPHLLVLVAKIEIAFCFYDISIACFAISFIV